MSHIGVKFPVGGLPRLILVGRCNLPRGGRHFPQRQACEVGVEHQIDVPGLGMRRRPRRAEHPSFPSRPRARRRNQGFPIASPNRMEDGLQRPSGSSNIALTRNSGCSRSRPYGWRCIFYRVPHQPAETTQESGHDNHPGQNVRGYNTPGQNGCRNRSEMSAPPGHSCVRPIFIQPSYQPSYSERRKDGSQEWQGGILEKARKEDGAATGQRGLAKPPIQNVTRLAAVLWQHAHCAACGGELHDGSAWKSKWRGSELMHQVCP